MVVSDVVMTLYLFLDLQVMTLDSFNTFTVTVTPQSVLLKYTCSRLKCYVTCGHNTIYGMTLSIEFILTALLHLAW